MKNLPHAVLVNTERPTFPERCVCCGGKPETSHVPTQPGRQPGLPEPEEPLRFPYCNACLAHFVDWQKHSGDLLVATNLVIWGVAIPLSGGLSVGWLAIGPTAALAYWLSRRRTPRSLPSDKCSTGGTACRAIWYRRGAYSFSFTNCAIADEFRKLNASVLTAAER